MSILQLVAVFLVFANIALRIPSIRGLNLALKFVTLGVLGLLLQLPILGLPFINVVGTLMGHISMLSILLLLILFISHFFQSWQVWLERSQWTVVYGVVFVGLGFYSLSSGLTLFDPYELGYQPSGMLMVLFLVTMGLWFSSQAVPALCLVFCVLGYQFSVLPSNNLWDYLIDPNLFITVFSITCFKFGRLFLSIFATPNQHT